MDTKTTARTITLYKDKECKGSVRYSLPDYTSPADAFNAPTASVYISRAAWPTMPDGVIVTIQPSE